jgi:rubrerythrin
MNKERLKALEIAMEREEEAQKFYLDASEKVTNAFAQDMFRSFAEEEEKHLQKVKEVYDRLKEERRWPKLVTSIGDVVKTKAVFPQELEELNMTKKDIEVNLEILKLGIAREEQSITFYHGLAEKATDPFETRFFIALEHEERGHYLSLWDYREYLEDPAGWFSMKEGYRLDAG